MYGQPNYYNPFYNPLNIQPQNQQPAINQTFQLSSNQQGDLDARYANDIEEAKNSLVLKNTLFIDKDYSNLWLKDISGKIKTYSLTEVVELDNRDKEILSLKQEILDLKEMISNAKSDTFNVNEPTTKQKSSNISTNK